MITLLLWGWFNNLYGTIQWSAFIFNGTIAYMHQKLCNEKYLLVGVGILCHVKIMWLLLICEACHFVGFNPFFETNWARERENDGLTSKSQNLFQNLLFIQIFLFIKTQIHPSGNLVSEKRLMHKKMG